MSGVRAAGALGLVLLGPWAQAQAATPRPAAPPPARAIAEPPASAALERRLAALDGTLGEVVGVLRELARYERVALHLRRAELLAGEWSTLTRETREQLARAAELQDDELRLQRDSLVRRRLDEGPPVPPPGELAAQIDEQLARVRARRSQAQRELEQLERRLEGVSAELERRLAALDRQLALEAPAPSPR